MSHSEHDTCFLDCCLHSDAVFDTGGHGLFTEDMVSLFRESERNFKMLVILDSDDHGICQPFPDRADCFG